MKNPHDKQEHTDLLNRSVKYIQILFQDIDPRKQELLNEKLSAAVLHASAIGYIEAKENILQLLKDRTEESDEQSCDQTPNESSSGIGEVQSWEEENDSIDPETTSGRSGVIQAIPNPATRSGNPEPESSTGDMEISPPTENTIPIPEESKQQEPE